MKRSGPPRRKKALDRGEPLARGKGLSRSGELGRGSGLARGGELKRSGPPAQRSPKREAHMREERVPLVRRLIAEGQGCRICPALDVAGIPHPRCPGIQGMHERRKSGAGGSRINPANLVPACNWSNTWVEDEPELARSTFGVALVVREVDEEWEALSKRRDREAGLD